MSQHPPKPPLLSSSRTGGELIADALIAHGVDTIFCVPGESFLGSLDAFYARQNKLRVIACRHEAGAVNMAEAAGKFTGKPGIAFVTRGPGATQGSVGVHTAMHDSTPLILFIGQVERAHRGRQAFQEVDFEKMFAPLAKWAVEVRDPAQLPEIVAEAFRVAMTGRRGPVVVSLPEDIQLEKAVAIDVAPKEIARPAPTPDQMSQLAQILEGAKRPLVLLGGSGWNAESRAQFQAFAERQNLPVVTSFRRIDLFDNTHRCYAGNVNLGVDPKLAQRIKDADVILAVGTRLGDIVTAGYTLLEPPKPKQILVHVHSDATDLNRIYQARLAIHSTMDAFAAALAAMPALKGDWAAWTASARSDYEAFIVPRPTPAAVDLAGIFSDLARRLPADTVITNGAGNYTGWHSRYFVHQNFRTYAGPTSGAMGYGVPAAIAAKAVFPQRTVIALAGDGCFMMAAQELATAHQYNLPIIVLVLNNGMYGTIRMHQERNYPERTIATNLVNPDFAALARAYGGHGETVSTTAEFWPALERARASGKVAVIDIKMDPEAITTSTTLSAITAKAKS